MKKKKSEFITLIIIVPTQERDNTIENPGKWGNEI
jgi:hypothetical protein